MLKKLVFLMMITTSVSADWDSFEFQGFPVYAHMPANPVGIVLFLHGSGGSAEFATLPASVLVINQLSAAGYGFFATSSTQRDVPKRWNPQVLDIKQNPDLKRLHDLYFEMHKNYGLKTPLPLFPLGMSNGATMSTTAAYVLKRAGIKVPAVAAYQGGFARPLVATGEYNIPTYFALARNDHLVDNARLKEVHDMLKREGVAAEFIIAEPTRVTPDWLQQYGASAPEKAFQMLVDAKIVDLNGERQIPLSTMIADDLTLQPWVKALGNDATNVRNGLMAAWAMHKMRFDQATRQIAFFETHRQHSSH